MSATSRLGKALPLPPLPFLHECFVLDEGSPSGLQWRKRPASHFKNARYASAWNAKFAFTPAGFKRRARGKENYWVARISSSEKTIYFLAHRVVWALNNGQDPGRLLIDHRDGDTLNNAPGNLRAATDSENTTNSRRKNGSGYRGVVFHKESGRWFAKIQKSLGYYDTKEEAARAYEAAAESLHRDFALHLSRPRYALPKEGGAIDLIEALLKGVEL